jgi:hypothetical protein
MITGKISKILVPPLLVCTLLWVSQILDACSDLTIKLVKCLIKELKKDREYELLMLFLVLKRFPMKWILNVFVQNCQIHNKSTITKIYIDRVRNLFEFIIFYIL